MKKSGEEKEAHLLEIFCFVRRFCVNSVCLGRLVRIHCVGLRGMFLVVVSSDTYRGSWTSVG